MTPKRGLKQDYLINRTEIHGPKHCYFRIRERITISIYLSIYLHVSTYLSIYRSIYLSIYLPIYLSFYLSIRVVWALLSGLVVERPPAALIAGVQTLGGEPKNFQYCLSSAENQQPVDLMRRKARGCHVLSVL